MYRKDMRRSDWHRILEREYAARDFEHGGKRARECLMLIKKAAAPLSVQNLSRSVKIVDDGYHWIQTAVEGEFVWLTAMFDETGTLLQVYFDITAGNRFDDPENPCFDDMDLDIVLSPDGWIGILDENELDEALAAGEITQEEYERAKEACNRLYKRLEEHGSVVLEYCKEALLRLKNKL